MPGDETWTDAQPGSLLRTLLVARGWALDRDVWVALHAPFTAGWDELAPAMLREAAAVRGVAPTASRTDVDERASVQQAVFTHPTPRPARPRRRPRPGRGRHRLVGGPGQVTASSSRSAPIRNTAARDTGAGSCWPRWTRCTVPGRPGSPCRRRVATSPASRCDGRGRGGWCVGDARQSRSRRRGLCTRTSLDPSGMTSDCTMGARCGQPASTPGRPAGRRWRSRDRQPGGAGRRATLADCSSASSCRARCGEGADPPCDPGSHQAPGGRSG